MIEIINFKEQEKKANENITKILNPVPFWKKKYLKVQENLMKEIFKD
ncbi:MAG: hypothetical protein QXF25_02000 [Candidatus Pacearchaeota archaeon]